MKLRFTLLLIILTVILCSCVMIPPVETDTKDAGTSIATDANTTHTNNDKATNDDPNYGIMLPYETGPGYVHECPGYVHESVESELVSYEYKHANMSIRVVEGWKYEVVPQDDNSPFGIKIYPENKADSYITLFYYPNKFGVCGTGLIEEKTTLSGISANKGYYDGSQIWSFIAAGDYAIWNNMSDGTFSLYRDDIELMIDSVIIADGVITPEEAKQIAAENLSDSFTNTKYMVTEFEHIDGVWEVSLYMDEEYSVLGAKVFLSSEGTFIAEELFAIAD